MIFDRFKKTVDQSRSLINGFQLDRREKLFIRHNQEVWKDFLQGQESGEILLESNTMSSSVIAYSYLANLLAQKHQSRIVAYLNGRLKRLTNRKAQSIYRSFNVRDFVCYHLAPSQAQAADRLLREIASGLKSKKAVEDLCLEGVWVGDLIYDSYCMNYKVPTVLLTDPRFWNSLKDAVRYYVFWRDYFTAHDVRAVIVSHTVYLHSGMLTRLAICKGIPVYQINATHLHYMTEKNILAYNEFFYYPEQFRELPEEERQKGLQVAQERLQKRFAGEVGVDMHYSKKSAYGRIAGGKVLKESPRLKILVATHCFFDSPHPYGVNLFPDFYEWLYFLGEISKQTDHDWYIKTHPDFLPGNIPIVREFISKYPKFTLLPSETSHMQLIEEGINFGLTVYGTIGFEYAALGIPVITASRCNPRIRYNFNIHPRDVDEYRQILLNLSSQKLEIDLNEVYEYYFMAFIHNVNDWLFPNYESFIQEIGGYQRQFESVSYEKFLNRFSSSRHGQILQSLNSFIESGEYNLRRKFLKDSAA